MNYEKLVHIYLYVRCLGKMTNELRKVCTYIFICKKCVCVCCVCVLCVVCVCVCVVCCVCVCCVCGVCVCVCVI